PARHGSVPRSARPVHAGTVPQGPRRRPRPPQGRTAVRQGTPGLVEEDRLGGLTECRVARPEALRRAGQDKITPFEASGRATLSFLTPGGAAPVFRPFRFFLVFAGTLSFLPALAAQDKPPLRWGT